MSDPRRPLPIADLHPDLVAVLDSAAWMQRLVPETVLVGGSAAALYAGHRASYDHDHLLADLRERFDVVLEAVESEEEWVTNRVTPGKIILGRLGGIESGIRQLIRTTALQAEDYVLESGHHVRVPTADETLRVKAFLTVRRNLTRDYVDVAALSARYGVDYSARVLGEVDDFYADRARGDDAVASQVARQLASPRPRDGKTTTELANYKGLATQWHDWSAVTDQCRALAARMVEQGESA